MIRKVTSWLLVLIAIDAFVSRSHALAEQTEPDRQTKAGADASSSRSEMLTYIEVRSVIPVSEKTASDEKPGRILRYGLNYADVDRIVQAIPAIREVVPIREIRKPIRNGNRILDGRIIGTTASYIHVNRLEMERGRFLSQDDNDTYQNHAVIGSQVARSLFTDADPIGQSVKLGTDYYTIVGVVKQRANASAISGRFDRRDFNTDVYIPLNTCKLRFGERIVVAQAVAARQGEECQLSRLTLQLRDDAKVEDTAALIRTKLLEPFHRRGDVEVIVVRLHGLPR